LRKISVLTPQGRRTGCLLDFEGILAFLGGNFHSWGCLHLHEIPRLELYDRLPFDPVGLRTWAEWAAEEYAPVGFGAVVTYVVWSASHERVGEKAE
jgi:hypothetical protein